MSMDCQSEGEQNDSDKEVFFKILGLCCSPFIRFGAGSTKGFGKIKKKKEKIVQKSEQINTAKALWKIPKNELKEADYTEFYLLPPLKSLPIV